MADPSCNEVCSVLLSILHNSLDLIDASKNIYMKNLGVHVSTEAEEGDGIDEPNRRICLEPAQIGETEVNPLALGCHCRGDLARGHNGGWRGEVSTTIVTMVDNHTIAARTSQYQAGGSAVTNLSSSSVASILL